MEKKSDIAYAITMFWGFLRWSVNMDYSAKSYARI